MRKSTARKLVDKYLMPPVVAVAALAAITISAIAIPVLRVLYREEQLHPRKRK